MTGGSTLLDPPAPARPSSGGGGARGSDRGRDDGGGGRPEGGGPHATPLGNERLLMFLILIASSMLFMGLIGAFIVLRGASATWPPAGSPPLPNGLAINTAVIVASSAALAAAQAAKRRGKLAATRLGLLAATAGALAFLALQTWCWRELLLGGFGPATNNYGGEFYLLTIAHFAHAAIGFVLLTLTSAKSFRGYLISRFSLAVDLTAMFWHFVGFIWIVVWLLVRQ